ncbi:dihydropteroate synthase [Sphingorhabdus soli]|uniref:dihydropteroate synthase n=1 Tax=Flavisphingopyxis soli TaxID=2601267 RepID=A0A5C6U6Y1_9SPHN|nr:dihydropteroate synthase [Sphingorhabdus soli]TXC68687.1 dihydropteroate synthase [Sphingorhabdus soli]
MTYPDIPADARLYLEPACFVERPHDLDGRVARIARSMLWFAGWSVRWRGAAGSPKRDQALILVDAADAWFATLPAPLAEQAEQQRAGVAAERAPLTLGERTIRFDEARVMGVLNLTPDSFSDGGAHGGTDAAADAGFAMASAGASIVDVGGESTRPGAKPVWEGDETARVVPVIERLAKSGVALSVDTRKAAVMEAALGAGAGIVNDVSALLYDERALGVVRDAGCPVVLMHAPSQSSDPHTHDGYDDVVLDVYDWLAERIAAVVAAGIDRARIIVDPGIGFGKSVTENLAITNSLALFHTLGCPLLYGASRKRMIGAIDGEAEANDRLGGSIALHLRAVELGANIVRVHDVRETVQALKTWRALRDTALVG